MPPLPSTFDEEIILLINAIERHQKDISEFQIPRLRTCAGPLAAQQNLAAELREDVNNLARQVENIEVLIPDQHGENTRRDLTRVVHEFKATLASLRQDIRMALLTSKRLIDCQSRSRREELLNSNALQEKMDTNEKVTEDILMKANANVTEALQRTINLMQGELERSVLTTQMLDASTTSLRATSTTHDTLTNVLGASKQLIIALEKADWLDRLLIISALIFFLLVVLFILKQRIVDRSMRIAFWWTRFLPSIPVRSASLVPTGKGSTTITDIVTAALSSASAAASGSISLSTTSPNSSAAANLSETTEMANRTFSSFSEPTVTGSSSTSQLERSSTSDDVRIEL